MDTVRHPLRLQQGIFETICIEMGVTSGDGVDIISERRPPSRARRFGWFAPSSNSKSYLEDEQNVNHDVRTQRVAIIGREIIRAARALVKEELYKAAVKAKEEIVALKPDITQQELTARINEDEEVEKWVAAQQRIEGETMDGIQNWQYILVDTKIPNAFVTEMLPQRFFVTTGLFEQFVSNDDELAMVLGHEISHLILGHLSESNMLAFVFRGLEIFFLMLDPTDGVLSLFVAGFLASSRDALLAAYSRSHETEADKLGCRLAAMACFDTKRGALAFLKMHEVDMKQGTARKDLMATHPPSRERYDDLIEMSADENLLKYSYCKNLRAQIGRALTRAN